jgi:hypothetical protein
MDSKGYGRKRSVIAWRHLETSKKNLNSDGRSEARDLNPTPPEYEAGVPATQLLSSVDIFRTNEKDKLANTLNGMHFLQASSPMKEKFIYGCVKTLTNFVPCSKVSLSLVQYHVKFDTVCRDKAAVQTGSVTAKASFGILPNVANKLIKMHPISIPHRVRV